MERRNGPWTVLGSETKYRDAFIEVVRDRVIRPDGQPGTYATAAMKPGVAVLVVDRDGTAVLTRQFRYPLGRESVEVASGGVDEGEGTTEAARREVKEELGVEAGEWTDLGRIDPDISIVRCPVALFLARGLTWGEAEREGTEAMTTLRVPFVEAVRMVEDGRITHAPTCVLLLRARTYLGGVDRPGHGMRSRGSFRRSVPPGDSTHGDAAPVRA
jgi:8-oxo-dGTP pyrophosphatase MutT (NUDIX family)